MLRSLHPIEVVGIIAKKKKKKKKLHYVIDWLPYP